MICPQCDTEYRDGFTTCSDCGVALVGGSVAEAQAKVAGRLEPLVHETSPELVAELLDRLERAGIPYVIQAGTALAVFEGEEVDPEKPLPWEARVWVVDTFADEANAELEQARHEQLLERQRTVTERFLRETDS